MTRYGILFEVELLHDYYLNVGTRVFDALDDDMAGTAMRGYSVADFLSVSPTPDTQRRLAGHQMIFKHRKHGFLVGTKLDPSTPVDSPLVPPDTDLVLRFALRVTDPRFLNFTALGRTDHRFFRFGNNTGNSVAGSNHLSLPVPDHEQDRAYQAGEIRALASGPSFDLFQALRDTGPSATAIPADWQRIPVDTHDPEAIYSIGNVVLQENALFRARVHGPGPLLSNADEWESLGVLANQYACGSDALLLRPSLFNVDVSGSALSRARILITRPGETDPIRDQLHAAETGELTSLQINLEGLAPGPYRLEVLDAASAPVADLGFDFYLDEQAVRESWLGVVEIGAGTGDFALLDGAGSIRSPRFKLRFLNRATRWRYRFPEDQALGSGADVSVEGTDARILVTEQPRPLTRFGNGILLQADDPESPEVAGEVRLPSPEISRVRHHDSQWYSDIFLSNLPL
jgi:hypothetical protein